METKEGPFYIGIDVGTSSARAALVSNQGNVLAVSVKHINILEPEPGYYEQSSNDIWNACCSVVKVATKGIKPENIHGIGFDATCSLVVLDKEFKPVTVSKTGKDEWNIMMWMDHRASSQADRINKTKHNVLKYVGGAISLEMETPKLLWLKENLKDSWKRSSHFFDLPDFLTWRATGCLSRSQCSLVCKWTYVADGKGSGQWDDSYFKEIGLEDLCENNYSKIGNIVLPPGHKLENGLSVEAASDLGLVAGIPVGTSIIDAHAGGLGCMGCQAKPSHSLDTSQIPVESKLPLICGTSSCHMAVSKESLFVPGVWGPYFSAMVPGYWTNEGGQSATGKLLDHIVENHPAYPVVQEEARKRNLHEHILLNEILDLVVKQEGSTNMAEVTKNLQVWPDFHGNRSPIANANLRGMVCGLGLETEKTDLARMYLGTIQALAYGTRHILEALTKAGHTIKLLYACGGLAKNPLFVQTHADITGLPIILPDAKESVLVGAAILGANASGDFKDIQEAMMKMCGTGEIVMPNSETKKYHDKKYSVFLKMVQHQEEYAAIMNAN